MENRTEPKGSTTMVRVLRIMEYEYPTLHLAELHMSNWAVPANGSKDFGRGMIRSAAFMCERKVNVIEKLGEIIHE